MKDRIEKSTNELKTSDSNDPSLTVANEELENILDEELSRLPEKLQAAVVLCDLDGLTQKQAAEQLSVAPATIAERVSKGRRLLRNHMVQRGATFTLAGFAACVAYSRESAVAMTGSFVADVAAKSTLYAAGKSALEIGVSSSVIQTANKVISVMTKAKYTAVCLAALAVSTFVASVPGILGTQRNSAMAGTVFQDTFDDGDHTDGLPVTWSPSPFQPGSIDSSSGDLVLAPNAESILALGIAAGVLNENLGDTSVRTQLRVTETGGGAFVSARNTAAQTPAEVTGYFAGIAFIPEFGGSIVIAGRSAVSGEQGQTFFQTTNGAQVALLPYDVRQTDTVLQLDVIEDKISVWAWREGQEMPADPQFAVTDSNFKEPGFVGAILNNGSSAQGTAMSQSIFRYVHVADMPIHEIVPEPSTAALGSFALTGLAIFTWRRRH